MIVVDTNVIAYFFLTGDHSAKARQTYLKDPQWCVPLLWRSEFRNVLALYLRKMALPVDQAITIAREAEILLEPGEYRVATEHVLSLCAASPCSAYDCEFVVLARQLNVSLITSDKQILSAFPQTAISLSDFARSG